jgi:hypothetical protein
VPYSAFREEPHLLAKEVLMEFPNQLLMYMRKRGIKPLPRTEAERVEIGAHLSQAQYKRYGGDDTTLP